MLRPIIYGTVLMTLLGAVLSQFFLLDTEPLTRGFGTLAALGFYFVFIGAISMVLIAPASCLKNQRIPRAVMTLVYAVLIVAMVADLVVYRQYRFHISLPMLDLFINAGNTIEFSLSMWIEIIGLILAITAVSYSITWLANLMARRWRMPWIVPAMFGLVFIAQTLIYCLSYAFFVQDVIVVKERLPLYPNVTANRFLAKRFGIHGNTAELQVQQSKGQFRYPLRQPEFRRPEKPLNVVFLMADSLRADMFNEQVMPKTWRWARNKIRFENHLSSGHGTRSGIFSLFYGLPPNYWHNAERTNLRPVLINAMLEAGYDIQAFATAPLRSPAFDRTVFAGLPNLRYGSLRDADEESLRDFSEYLSKRDTSKPFFAWVFYDAPHAYYHPKDMVPFAPESATPDYLKLNNETDPQPLLNRYKNSVAYVDDLFERTLQTIDRNGLRENTIIVITSDHGQEINENRKNFWGHNSAYTHEQIQVPLIIHWPGRKTSVEKETTIVYDISTTLLRHALGLTSNPQDCGVGLDLFQDDLAIRKWFLMGGYNDNAIWTHDRVVVLNQLGLTKFYDHAYNLHKNTHRSAEIFEALDMLGRFNAK